MTDKKKVLDDLSRMQAFNYQNADFRFVNGDITEQDTDAIVNAANSSLMGGGGVDGAIHRAGGEAILKECIEIRRREWGDGLAVGKAVITTGGNLRARFVIHTVGPVWRGGRHGEPELLADAHRNSLALANSKDLKSISFPAISTGAYGYPIDLAARVAIESSMKFMDESESIKLNEIRFVLFTSEDLRHYLRAAEKLELQ